MVLWCAAGLGSIKEAGADAIEDSSGSPEIREQMIDSSLCSPLTAMNNASKALIALLGMLFLASAAQAQNWDLAKSQQMVRLAWSAYCPPQDVFSWSCYWCKDSGTPKLSIVNTVVDGPTKYARFSPDAFRAYFSEILSSLSPPISNLYHL